MDGRVVGIVMSSSDEFGSGITHKRVFNYLEELGVYPQAGPGDDPPTWTRTDPTIPGISGRGIDAPKLPITKIGKDGAPMVFIPAGEFWMGSPEDESRFSDERPRHKVFLDPFYLDIFEVTTSQYAQFMSAKGHAAPEFWDQVDSSRDEKKPVIGVSWQDAKDFCEWGRQAVADRGRMGKSSTRH